MAEPTDLIIVTVRGTRTERELLLEQAKAAGVSLNTWVRWRLGLVVRQFRERDRNTAGVAR